MFRLAVLTLYVQKMGVDNIIARQDPSPKIAVKIQRTWLLFIRLPKGKRSRPNRYVLCTGPSKIQGRKDLIKPVPCTPATRYLFL
jgi:hypothetical protein